MSGCGIRQSNWSFSIRKETGIPLRLRHEGVI
jgi:hypothetical protein